MAPLHRHRGGCAAPLSDKMLVTSRHPVCEKLQKEFEEKEPEFFADPRVKNLFRALRMDARFRRNLIPLPGAHDSVLCRGFAFQS